MVQSLAIGLLQCLALWPGMSRSMVTLVGGYLVGLRPVRAAEFSFLMSVIAILGAAVRALPELGSVPSGMVVPLAIAAASALVFGIAAIWLFVRLLQSRGFHYFAYYTWAAGFTVLVGLALAAGR